MTTRISKAALEAATTSGNYSKKKMKEGTGILAVSRFKHLSDIESLDILEGYIERKGETTWSLLLFLSTAKTLLSTDRSEIRKHLIKVAAIACAWANSIDKAEENKNKD